MKKLFILLLLVMFYNHNNFAQLATNTITIGAGGGYNSDIGNPSPYTNYLKNYRVQYFYLASELIAAGASSSGGAIT